MRKLYFLIVAGSLLLLNGTTVAQRSNCSASPYPLTIQQADGSELTILTIGNEMLHYKETPEGYTVLPNKEGIYEYAILDNTGNLQLSGIKAANRISQTAMAKQAPERHLRFSPSQVAIIKHDFETMHAEAMKLQKTVEVSYPVSGNIRIIAICMQFPDMAAAYPVSALSDLMNQTNYNNTGSFKDYFVANSYGKMTPQVDVYGWYTTTLNRESYGQKLNNGSNNPSYNANVRNLVGQAIDSADVRSNVDFTIYDNDNNGSVDGIIIFHAGYGAEQGFNGYIWSHRSSLGGSARVKDGKTISSYCINPTLRNWQGDIRMVGLGVLTHEFGHIMGLPDLYDTDNSSEGIGNFGLMGACGWLNQERTPCQLEAWSKDQFDWLRPVILNNPGEYTLKHTLDTAACYRINTPRTNEYFLLENRQQRGWDRFLPSRGLAIWHINTARTSLYPGSNTVNADSAQYGVGLKQADGQRHLERGTNRGDAGDLFPGSTNNRMFNDNTNPSARLHFKVGGVNQPSNVTVSNITLNSDSTVTFRIGLASTAAFSPAATQGCAPFRTVLTNNSTAFASYKWYLPDGSTNNTQSDLNIELPQPGSYTVALVIYDSLNNRLDSTSQTLTVFESPKAGYTYTQIGNQIRLRNNSTGHTLQQWRLGTNTSSTQDSLTFTIPPAGLNFYIVAISANGCTDTAFGFVLPFATGQNEIIPLKRFTAYPVPFQNSLTLNVDWNEPVAFDVEVRNMLGEMIQTQHYLPATNTIDWSTADWTNGVYLITIKSALGTYTTRVIKTN
jgi:M6 family metalloprotease-like protein